MMENNSEEKFIHDLVSKSKLKVPFSDFDDKIMLMISRKRIRDYAVSRYLKLSWIFFILGAVFGIIISIILPTIHETFLGIQLDKLASPFQILFAFLLVTLFGNLKNFYKVQEH